MFTFIKAAIKSVVSTKAPAKVDLTAIALQKANQEIEKVLSETTKLYESGETLVTYKKLSQDNELIIEQTMLDIKVAREKRAMAQHTYDNKSADLVDQKVSEAKKAQKLLDLIG